MKNIFSYTIFAAIALLSTSAFAAFTPFTTITQAEQYCPPVTGLTFVATNPKIPNSAGNINGNFNNVSFKNFEPNPAFSPQNMNMNGIIQNVQFREDNNMYGYNSNNVISCFYSYSGFTGGNVYLVMRQS